MKLLSGLDLGDTAVAGNRHRANGVRSCIRHGLSDCRITRLSRIPLFFVLSFPSRGGEPVSEAFT